MTSLILSILNVIFVLFVGVIALFFNFERKKKRKRYLTIISISLLLASTVLTIIIDRKNHIEEESYKDELLEQFMTEQANHNELIEKFVMSSHPLENLKIEYKIELDSNFPELVAAIKECKSYATFHYGDIKNGNYNIPLTQGGTITKEKYPILYGFGNHLGLNTAFLKKDSIIMEIQSGANIPIKGFKAHIEVRNHSDYHVVYTDQNLHINYKDYDFNSFHQLKFTTVRVMPLASNNYRTSFNQYFKNLKTFSISDQFGNKFICESFDRKMEIESIFLTYRGSLELRKGLKKP